MAERAPLLAHGQVVHWEAYAQVAGPVDALRGAEEWIAQARRFVQSCTHRRDAHVASVYALRAEALAAALPKLVEHWGNIQ